MAIPNHGLIFWTLGFGAFRVIYGLRCGGNMKVVGKVEEKLESIKLYEYEEPIENLNKIFDSRVRLGHHECTHGESFREFQ